MNALIVFLWGVLLLSELSEVALSVGVLVAVFRSGSWGSLRHFQGFMNQSYFYNNPKTLVAFPLFSRVCVMTCSRDG